MKLSLSVFLLLISVTWLTAPRPAVAEETTNGSTPWKRININLGGFIAATESSVRLGSAGVGLAVDAEDALGLDSTTTAFRTDAFWRFTESKRHRVDFTWFSLSRDASTTIGQDIEFDGTVYPAGSTVSTELDFDIYKAAYSYSFFQDDRIDLAGAVGLYVAPIAFDINATGNFTGSSSQSLTAPLPVIGLRADFAITPKWFLRSRVDAFYVEIDGYKGLIMDVQGAVEYHAFKHVGFGLGFESFDLQVEANQDTSVPGVDFQGEFELRYAGVLAYMKVYFD